MGSCISKCRPKTSTAQEECNHVQDKLVILQAPKSPIPLLTKKSPSPSPSPSSTCSFSSFSCTTSKTSSSGSLPSSLSLLSSCSSSTSSSKDRSFSNEFLWSCVKENPHIVRIDPIKGSTATSVPSKIHALKLESPAKRLVAAPVKQSIPQRLVGSTPQKRARANSPTLTRQKSFRKEPERPNSTYSLPCRTLRSPSPSRRFNGEKCRGDLTNTHKESYCKRSVGSKANAVSSVSSYVSKDYLRPASPNNNLSRPPFCLRNRETCSHQIGSKVDEIAVGEVLSNQDINSIPIEDIDNPLISLDCFIFL